MKSWRAVECWPRRAEARRDTRKMSGNLYKNATEPSTSSTTLDDGMDDMRDAELALRPAREDDLESVIALDRSHSGQSRRGFFEKRWRAMARAPEAFISLAAEWENALAGFVLAHVLDGEFGGSERVVVLDAVGVANDARGNGIGTSLMQALVDEVRERGAGELRTQARWDQRGLLEFFAKVGFRLAPSVVLERSTGEAGW